MHVSRTLAATTATLISVVSLSMNVAQAQGQILEGRVVLAEGHINPNCRRLRLRTDSGSEAWFRIPDTGADNSILSVALTALNTGRKVQIAYDGSTTGCGTEPRISYISALAD